MISTLSLFLWLIGLFLVLKYRVHIHVNISTDNVTNKRRPLSPKMATPGSGSELVASGTLQEKRCDDGCEAIDGHGAEIASALEGLGCKKEKARQIAKGVCSQPGTFDDQLRAAIREAA